MSFINVSTTTDELGRPVETYIDTDDMSNEDYAEYCEAKREVERLKLIRSKHKDEGLYLLIGDGTLEQLNEAQKRVRRIIHKYT